MPKFTKTPEKELEDFEKKIVTELLDNDRPFSLEEEENEKKAIKFSAFAYPRILPIPGTLGFRLRNVRGGNESVMRFLANCSDARQKRFIREFLILWKLMDEYSKKRVDIFDILCEKYEVSKKKFWGSIQEGMFDDSEAMMQAELHANGAEFIQLIKKMARMPKNFKDRELLAKALGLTKDVPFLQINDNSKHETRNTQVNIQNNNIPSFASSIRRSEKVINDQEPIIKPLELSEGAQDFIEAEWHKVDGDETDMLLARVEQNLKESSKEMR